MSKPTHDTPVPHLKASTASLDEAALDAAPRANPTIPLTPEARAAYQTLNQQYEVVIQSTHDVGVLEALLGSQLDVQNILIKDNMYRLHASTDLYDALLDQINSTNDGLAAIRKQIAAIAGNIATAADILAAIDKVLKVVPIP